MNTIAKSILSITWKVGLGLTGLIALCFGILVAGLWYDKNYGREEWADENLSADVVVEAFNDGRVRVRNMRTGRCTTPKLQWVSGAPERDSLTVFCSKDRRGFLNVMNGEVVIPAQYGKAWQFSEGLGAVLGENGKVGFIDRENKLVIPCEIPYEKGLDYIFKDGYCKVARWDGNEDGYIYAVYDKSGKTVLPWGCTYVSDMNSDGFCIVGNDDGERLYDRDFRPVFQEVYEDVSFSTEGGGVFLTKNHVKQFVDYSGKVIEPFVIDGTRPLKYMVKFNENDSDEYEWVPDIAVYTVNSWEGLLDLRTGRAVTPADYWVISMVSKDYVEAKVGYGTESVILDKRGNVIEQ